jgi:4-hydroxybenzoate polyprenyltransferase
MPVIPEQQRGLLARLWIYQGERFPLAKTTTLLALFSAASINVSAALAGASRPSLLAYLVAFFGSLVFFAQLRACDEVKDGADDARYRPERPIPRGLVSLKTIVTIGFALVPAAIVAAASYHPPLVWLLALVWLWMGLMTVEFFAPEWLKARPLLYLVSHMAIMPLIDLFVTACEWLPRGGWPPSGLWLFLVLSFINGCVLELGRKIYAPVNEREGVDTYSSTWGIPRALGAWCGCLALSAVLLTLVGVAMGRGGVLAVLAGLGLLASFQIARSFQAQPTPAGQKHLDLVAGLWVAFCYAAAGVTAWSAL